MSKEVIKQPRSNKNILSSIVEDIGTKEKVKFNGSSLIQLSNSAHANNRTKNILVLGKDFTQELDNAIIYVEKLYSVNFTKPNTKFCLSLHYNGSNSYLFVKGKEIQK